MSFSAATLRLAHLSDPHFAAITWNPSQFLSKRWIGNWNLILFRQRQYQTQHLVKIPQLLSNLHVDIVCLTGDFSSTSLDEEFKQALQWIADFKDKGLDVITLPGNHDFYTRESERAKRFYQYMPSSALESSRVEKKKIKEGWWWVGLDCALATLPFFSYGVFSTLQHDELIKILHSVPKEDHIVIGNHFPLFTTGKKRHDLVNAEDLQKIIQSFPNVKLYLHGHDHAPYIINRMGQNFPLVINSGSCSHHPDGGFYLIDVEGERCVVKRYRVNQIKNVWEIATIHDYKFGSKSS